jgi:hypothetical protein
MRGHLFVARTFNTHAGFSTSSGSLSEDALALIGTGA